MSRRKTQIFNLSLLDLLTSALGAIIFLFIITPKGGESASEDQQAFVYFDTTQMKIHGDLHDSLLYKNAGDTLFTVLVSYKELPKKEEAPKRLFAFNEREEIPVSKEKEINKPPEVKNKKESEPVKVETAKESESKPPEKEPVPEKTPVPEPPTFRGDAPSVPCKVSIEISWLDKNDNVDLFVCSGSNCVYGARKKDKKIGQWDSGKSRNRLFGNDLRTNQEAVRQFDEIIPGEYKIYAQFKESKSNKQTVNINGLIYTKDEKNNERGESFSKLLKLGNERTLIGTIVLQKNGFYQFKKS